MGISANSKTDATQRANSGQGGLLGDDTSWELDPQNEALVMGMAQPRYTALENSCEECAARPAPATRTAAIATS